MQKTNTKLAVDLKDKRMIAILREKKHPHHVADGVPRSRKRIVKGGLKQFRP